MEKRNAPRLTLREEELNNPRLPSSVGTGLEFLPTDVVCFDLVGPKNHFDYQYRLFADKAIAAGTRHLINPTFSVSFKIKQATMA